MKLLLPFLLFCLTASAQWTAGFYSYATGQYVPESTYSETSIAEIQFREFNLYTNRPYLLGPLTTTDSSVTGDLRGKRITLRGHLVETGDSIYVWRAWNTWNPPPRFANFRLFFSTHPEMFNIAQSNGDTLSYWWSSIGVVELSVTNSFIMVVDFNSEWTAAHGESSTVEEIIFQQAISHVAQIGIMFSGGRFYDLGVSTEIGTSIFVLDQFDIAPLPQSPRPPKKMLQDANILLEVESPP